MSAYPVLRRFTPEEYLRLERASRTKNEYVDGLIYAMAGATFSHDRIVMNATFLLQSQLRDGKCTVNSADFRIAVSQGGPYFYPDLSVICGKPKFLDDSLDCAMNPVVVVEVLSKSTRKFDRETKVERYYEVPTLRHIVLISQFAVAVEHHFRVKGGKWRTEKLETLESAVKLAAVGASLPLAAIYDRMTLTSRLKPPE